MPLDDSSKWVKRIVNYAESKNYLHETLAACGGSLPIANYKRCPCIHYSCCGSGSKGDKRVKK